MGCCVYLQSNNCSQTFMCFYSVAVQLTYEQLAFEHLKLQIDGNTEREITERLSQRSHSECNKFFSLPPSTLIYHAIVSSTLCEKPLKFCFVEFKIKRMMNDTLIPFCDRRVKQLNQVKWTKFNWFICIWRKWLARAHSIAFRWCWCGIGWQWVHFIHLFLISWNNEDAFTHRLAVKRTYINLHGAGGTSYVDVSRERASNTQITYMIPT